MRRLKRVFAGDCVHVRHVVRQFHPIIGGMENTVASLVLALRDAGIDGSIVTLDRNFQQLGKKLPAEDSFQGIPVRRIPFAGSTRYPVAPSILRHLDGADLVHVHAIDFFFDFLALTRLVHRRPMVASTHGGFFHTAFAKNLKKAFFHSVTRTSATAYRRIIGSSENDAALFKRIAPGNTISIENGVDVEKWRDAGNQAPVEAMLALGRFSSNKALPDLIALVARLGPPWRLVIAGQPSDLGAEDLHAQARALNVHDRVSVHVGLDEAALRNLLPSVSYIASASRFEGFGLTAIEGLSAGLVPILNDIPPFRRVVTQTKCGLLIEAGQTLDAATKVKAYHARMVTDHARTRAAAIEASCSYGWSRVSSSFVDAYQEALGR